MKITLQKIKIKDLYDGFIDKSETGEGIVAFNGYLNVQPKYQREFIYDDVRQEKVIKSIINNFPINVMYWLKLDDTHYEMLDGQQRTVSICRFIKNNFKVNLVNKTTGQVDPKYFDTLSSEISKQFLNYELYVYICEGDSSETLDWFQTINISGVSLNEQEMRNAIYSGPFVESLKRYFAKRNCAFEKYSLINLKDYVTGQPIRQDIVEIALDWVSLKDDTDIKTYMSRRLKDENAKDVFDYFVEVISRVKSLFVDYRKEMKSVDWGRLYDYVRRHRPDLLTVSPDVVKDFSDKVTRLMEDEEVTRKKGIYEYLITGEEKALSIRKFDDRTKRTVYERQDGKCAICGEKFDISECEADHIIPWSKGGKTVIDNCQILCKKCNSRKTNY